MVSRYRPGPERAALHESRARNYRRQTLTLLERDADLDSAGALLYESAKQCINAVANQEGINPGPTGAKQRFLNSIANSIAEPETTMRELMLNRYSASALHTHADQGYLSAPDFMDAWGKTHTFIDRMLLLYNRRA